MRRVLWWVTLATLATICALIATAPVPPVRDIHAGETSPAVIYESEQP